MQTLYALDLTETPGTGPLWRKQPGPRARRESALELSTNLPGLPQSGFASPAGFWFATAHSWTTGKPRLRVELFELDEPGRANLEHDNGPRNDPGTGRTIRARLRAPTGRARARSSTVTLHLEIDSNVARIEVDADTWSSVGETVLFAVAQYWRFEALDRMLGDLSDWARDDLEKTRGFQSVIRPGRSRELRARLRALQALILDLPDFEGALTDPHGHLAAGGGLGPLTPARSPEGARENTWGLRRRARLYRRLTAGLGLDQWRREIDERVEVVEAVFDSLTESLNHFQSLAFQIALELVIVALLLLDVGLYFLDGHVGK